MNRRTIYASICCFFLAFTSTVVAQELPDLDATQAFDDVYYKMPVDSLDKKVLYEARGNFRLYRRETDRLKIGDVKISSVSYIFHHKNLVLISFRCKGKKNIGRMFEMMESTYGQTNPGETTKNNQWVSYWYGEEVTAQYFEDNNLQEAFVHFYDNDLLTLLNTINAIKQEIPEQPNWKRYEKNEFKQTIKEKNTKSF